MSFVLIVAIWGENGVYARRSLEYNRTTLESALKEKEGDVARLRTKEGLASSGGEEADRTFVHVFQNGGVYGPGLPGQPDSREYKGIGILHSALLALVPAALYASAVLFIGKVRKQKRRARRKRNASYND